MAEQYQRYQILLEPEQHDRMRHIADREDRSISDVARELIAVGLEALANDQKRLAERRGLALEHLNELREKAEDRYGDYEGDLVAEARSEREGELARGQKDQE